MRDTKRFSLPALGLMLALPFLGVSQKLVLEKTYEVDKKAKKGFLNEVIVNPKDNTTTLSFVTKSKGSKVNFQDYTFDKEYNFVKVEAREAEYTSKKYKGEQYVIEGITLEPGMTGGLIVKKKRTEYSWSWLNLGYTWKTTVLEKIKLKDESGNKYYLVKKYENEADGNILALVTTKEGGYTMLKIDQSLKMEVVDKFDFNKAMSFRESFILPQGEEDGSGDTDASNEDISFADMCFVFSATWTSEASRLGKHTDYEMIRINNKGKIQNRSEFTVQASDWDIISVISDAGSMYLVGPANPGKELKGSSASMSWGDNPKWKLYQVAKITGDKADYVTATNMDDFEAKLKKPASQKKSPAYKGRKFTVRDMTVTSDGSLFIYGQNTDDKKWEDVLTFYFDNKGVLKAQYGVRLEERNSFSEVNMARQFITSTDKYAYWQIWELKGMDDGYAQRYPSIAQINLSTGEIGEFQKFGLVKDDPTYFLQNKFPFIINPADKSLVYLSVNKKGNIFWFGKVVCE